MNQNRVVMLLFNSYNPDPRVMKEARSLKRHGYEVDIIAWNRTGRHPPMEMTDAGLVMRVGPTLPAAFDQLSIVKRAVLKAHALMTFGRRAVGLAVQRTPRIVHCHDLDTLPLGVLVKSRTGAHLVYDSHENYPAMIELRLGSRAGHLVAEVEKGLLPAADRIIADNKMRAARFSRSDIRIVMNVNESPDNLDLQFELKHTTVPDLPDQPVVIYAGGLEPGRGLLEWIDAKQYLEENVTYLVLGDGEMGPAMKERCIELGLADVCFLGRFHYLDLPSLLSLGDIGVNLNQALPNNISGTPGKMFEYMASGLPVISSNLPAMRRIIENEKAGVIVDSTDPSSIAEGIEWLVRNSRERVEMGRNGRMAVRQKYNWSVMESILLELYSGLGKAENA